MNDSDGHPRRHLSAAEVLELYQDLPAFCTGVLCDVNQAGLRGERPLGVAAVRGNLDEISALVMAGADVNAPGELGNTPLHEAVHQNRFSAAKLLLECGPRLDLRNEFGETPLDIAQLRNREELVALLRSASQ